MEPVSEETLRERRARRVVAVSITFFLCLAALSILCERRLRPVEGRERPSLQVKSASFSDGGSIPRRYTCDGADLSPEVQWTATPTGTKSFALVMHDPDAPVDFTHWVAYNIGPDLRELAEGASSRAEMPKGSAEGANSYGRLGYAGPCPPAGKPHHYVLCIYALDSNLALPAGAMRQRVEAALKGHVVAEGQMTGLYQRGGE
jgi:Raf kinase inhibitor-like YbhB/YbcL family protein